MATPALIVGLGGTGVKVLTQVKQDLLATHGGVMPEEVQLLAFDTERESDVQAGIAAVQTSSGAASAVKLGDREYVWIGGNVYTYVQDVAKGKHPHVGSWLQAGYYLETLPQNLFFLERGAGMLRQFGRLAIFSDVQKGEGLSKIYQMLWQSMTRVQKAAGTKTINVMLVSSVAGGTGAGMFVDIAYLLRQIADIKMTLGVALRGFLAMPEAFQTIPGGVTRDMRARAYAAMRENKRFMVKFDWENGYPMYYHGTNVVADGRDVWQGRIKSKLFDFLYYIDGRRAKNDLSAVPLDLGVAPTIADTIVAALDEEGGHAFAQHQINLNKVVSDQGNREVTATYSALGTFSFVLPLYYIIEAFSHQLALDALDTFLGCDPKDKDKDGVPIRLAPNRNIEAGDGKPGNAEARAFLGVQSVTDNQDATRGAENTALVQDIVGVTARYSPQNKDDIVSELAGRDLKTWSLAYTPSGAASAGVAQKVEATINQQLLEIVPPSNKVSREKPQDGLRRIIDGVKNYKAQHLGAEKPDGRRDGGEYRKAIEEYHRIHLDRFRVLLNLYAANILNGSSTQDYRQSRGGKLGFLIDFLDGVAKELDLFLDLLRQAREMRESQGARRDAMRGAQQLLAEMEKQASSRFPGAATRAQENYLNSEQRLIDTLRLETIELMAVTTITALREYVQDAHTKAMIWSNALGVGQNSLYADLVTGNKQVLVNRLNEEKIPVRQAVPSVNPQSPYFDPGYEQRLFHEYAVQRGDKVNEMLRDLSWQVTATQTGARTEFSIGLNVVVHKDGESKSSALTGNVRKHNVDLILDRAREAFAEAWKRESVLKYLKSKFASSGQDGLGEKLFDNSGILLEFGKRAPASPIPSNYLRVAFGESADDQDYLFQLKRDVADRSQVADDRFAQLVQSADRYKLTLIYNIDLIPVQSMESFWEAEGDYMLWRGTGPVAGRGRDILHLYPAEVNSVKYEDRAQTELEHKARMFEDKVVIQLENIDRFRLFANCYAFELITTGAEQEGGVTKNYLQLVLPEETTKDPTQPKRPAQEIRLTKSGEVSLLAALGTFNYVEKDMREGITRPIDFDRVRRAVQDVRRKQAQEIFDKGPELTPELKMALESKSVEKQNRIKVLIAEAQYIAAQRERLVGGQTVDRYVSETGTEVEGEVDRLRHPDRQKRDLYTALYLALNDETTSLREMIRNEVQ
ncbi:MAG: tubulin-like doman-containing protein [Chloroflexi bacterium]|nr:tubulin-like doman-containing protein [Chloroflexota bacterium]